MEGLSNFRGAVYDPVEGLQISKMASAEMRVLNLIRPCTHTCAHGTVWFASGGGWGGVGGVGRDINVLDVSAMALYHVCSLTVLSSFHIYVCTWYRIYALVLRGRRLAS